MKRCPWADGDPLYERYHDTEWGVPVRDDRKHFEFLVLETMQAGLSWRLVLSRREEYRRAFAGFDWRKVARYGAADVDRLMETPGLIHNRRKLEGAVKNAIAFEKARKEFGSFDAYVWSFSGGKPVVNKWKDVSQIPTRTELSDRAAADMKKRGFAFVGSVTVYAHFQAIGIVNDHLVSCFRHREAARAAPAGRDTMLVAELETPLGPMRAGVLREKLCLLEFADLAPSDAALARIFGCAAEPGRAKLHGKVEGQLGEYFRGVRSKFDVPLDLRGTEFQLAAWRALLEVEYGTTVSYAEQAKALGRPRAVRAVAAANAANRIAVIVPCHRVIASDGALSGYAGGPDRKRALLELEAKSLPRRARSKTTKGTKNTK